MLRKSLFLFTYITLDLFLYKVVAIKFFTFYNRRIKLQQLIKLDEYYHIFSMLTSQNSLLLQLSISFNS